MGATARGAVGDATTLSVEAYKALEAKQTTEAAFMRALVLTAHDYGWRTYHTRFSMKSDPGFPDLIMLRGDRCLAIECKRVGKSPTDKQREWLEAFDEVPGIESYWFTPEHWDHIHETLGRGWVLSGND